MAWHGCRCRGKGEWFILDICISVISESERHWSSSSKCSRVSCMRFFSLVRYECFSFFYVSRERVTDRYRYTYMYIAWRFLFPKDIKEKTWEFILGQGSNRKFGGILDIEKVAMASIRWTVSE